MLVDKNVHASSQCINYCNTTFDIKNVLVNVKISINKYCKTVHC